MQLNLRWLLNVREYYIVAICWWYILTCCNRNTNAEELVIDSISAIAIFAIGSALASQNAMRLPISAEVNPCAALLLSSLKKISSRLHYRSRITWSCIAYRYCRSVIRSWRTINCSAISSVFYLLFQVL